MTPAASPGLPWRPFEGGQYRGQWHAERPEGRGEHLTDLGASFHGSFHEGWAKGPGTFHWADGRSEVSRFHGPLDRLPLLAASGEGARWSRDRTVAWRLRDGVERESISLAEASRIAAGLGLEVPPSRPPRDHGAAKVTKREMDGLVLPLLSKRQRVELQQHGQEHSGAAPGGAAHVRREAGEVELDAVPFEQVWKVLTSTTRA